MNPDPAAIPSANSTGSATDPTVSSPQQDVLASVLVTALVGSHPVGALALSLRDFLPPETRAGLTDGEILRFAGSVFRRLAPTSDSPSRKSKGFHKKLSSTLLTVKDDGAVPATLKVMPFELELKAAPPATLKARGKACLVELKLNVSEDTTVGVEGLCAGTEGGLALTRSRRGGAGKSPFAVGLSHGGTASLVEFTASQDVTAGPCEVTVTARAGVGSAGSEFKLTGESVKVYQGFGTVGVGGEVAGSCDGAR